MLGGLAQGKSRRGVRSTLVGAAFGAARVTELLHILKTICKRNFLKKSNYDKNGGFSEGSLFIPAAQPGQFFII